MLHDVVAFIFPPQCGGCGKIGTGACDACVPRDAARTSSLQSLSVTALGAYEGALKRTVLSLKSGRRDVASALADRLGEFIACGEVIVPVPTTAARRRERGFDGCELMARRVALRTSAIVTCGLVQTAGDRQKGRDRDARLAARGRFAWRGENVSGLRVALLDDVVTTGATLEDCAAVLRANGATVERAIVIARA